MGVVRRPKVLQHPAATCGRSIFLADIILNSERQPCQSPHGLSRLSSAINVVCLLQRALSIDINKSVQGAVQRSDAI